VEKRIHKFTFYHPVLEKVASCLPDGERCYLVGGFVRDRLLRVPKERSDLDLVCRRPELLLPCLRQLLNKREFLVEREKRVYSFVGDYWRLDLTKMDGRTIEEDLRKRDFTVNAMAVDLLELTLPFNDDAVIVDPTGGLEDLERGLIRPIGRENLLTDPLRVLRGVRIKNQLNFDYHESFFEWAKEAAPGLEKVAPERIREELLKALNGNFFSRFLRESDRVEAFFPTFVELKGIEKVPPSGVHQFDLKEHTFRTVEWCERLLERKSEVLLKYSESLGREELLPGLTDDRALLLAALYHDCAKPLTLKEKDGRLTFYDHDRLGAKIAYEAMLRLTFGKKVAKLVKSVVRHHLRPFFLYQLYEEGQLTERAVYRLFKDSKPYHFHLLLHACADFAATSVQMERELPRFLSFVHYLIDFYSRRLENLRPLLSGTEIMEALGLEKPSPVVGKAKEKLLELQALGKVNSREEALKFLKGFNFNENAN
jgi:poly(A) polymerase